MMMIIEVPESTSFATMPDEVKTQINKLGGQFVEETMIGTETVSGKKLIFTYVKADKATVELLTNNDLFDEDNEQYGFDLGWTVLATEIEQVNQTPLLPYFSDTPIIDSNGEITGYEAVTDLAGKLQVWAGKEWQY